MGGLVQKNHVELLPLILVHVPLPIAVAEADPAAVWEGKHPFRLFPLGNPRQIGTHGQNVVFPKLRQGSAQDQDFYSAVP